MLTHLASFEARLDINPSNTAQIASKRSPRSPMGAWHQFWHRQRPDRVPGTNFSGGWHQFCLLSACNWVPGTKLGTKLVVEDLLALEIEENQKLVILMKQNC
jgi:hypothetical protein